MRPSIVISMAVLASVAPSFAIPVSPSPSSPEWKREDASDRASSDDLESGAASTTIGKAATVVGIGSALIFGTRMLNNLLQTPPPQVVYVDQDGQPVQNQKRDIEEPASHDEDAQDGESGALSLVDAASLAGMATTAYYLTPILKEFLHPQQQQYKREYAELMARAPAERMPAPAAHHEEVVPEGGVVQKQELSKLDKMGLFATLGLGGVASLSMLKEAIAGDNSA